jgi:small subunit ribosomal protein S21
MANFENKFKGSTVFVKDNENINQALKRFKRKIEDSKLLDELRKRECFTKPCEARKKAKAAGKARWAKKLREQQLPKKMY